MTERVEPPPAVAATVKTGFWHCRNCNFLLAHVIGDSVVMNVRGRVFTFNASAPVRTECPRCHVTCWRNASQAT